MDHPARARRRDAALASRRLLATPAPRRRWAPATSTVAAHTDGPLDADALAQRRRPRHRPPLRRRSGRRPSTAARRCSTDAELDAIEAFVRDGGGLIVLGETEQDKYGNNLNELARPLRHRDRQRHASRTTTTTATTPRPGCSPTLERRLAARRRPARPRATTPASTAPARSRAANGARVLARASAAAPRPPARRSPPSPSTAPAASSSLADSDLFGDDCIGELDHEAPVAQPRLLGRAAAPSPTRRAGPRRRRRRPGVDPPARRGRRAAPHAGGRRLGRHRRARRGEPARAGRRRWPTPSQALAPRFPHQADYLDAVVRRPARLGRRRLRQARLHRSLEAFRPERDRRDGIEHLVRLPDVQAERLARHVLRGARSSACRGPSGSPSSSARATTTPSSSRSRWSTTRAATTPSAPSSSPRPSRSPSGPAEPLRRDLLRPRGRALPPRRRRGRRAAAAQPAARRRRAARLARALAVDAYMLWDLDPRPHAQPRRPAVRPVHDPPAQRRTGCTRSRSCAAT